MLMKPPSILDDLVSENSEAYTSTNKERNNRNRGVKKQNTIRIGGRSNQPLQKPRQIDNQSVNSNGSRKSKDKKTKETTLNRPKILGETSQYKSEDANSVHSNGSKHSHKSGKKQTTIMQRPKIESNTFKGKVEHEVKQQVEVDRKFKSFKEAIQEPQESIIRIIDPKEQNPRPFYNREPQKNQKIVNKAQNKNPKFTPFAQLDHHNSSDEQIPVYKLQQPNENKLKAPSMTVGKKNQNKNENIVIKPVIAVDESKSIFDESRMNQTKSRRRRDIFGKTKQIDNASKVSNTIQQSISGLDDTSRRKSKSRLREIFNNSRQKKTIEESVMPNQSKVSNLNQIQQSPSVYFKPATGNNDRMVQLQRKVINDEDDRFGEESSKSGLDLSHSGISGRNVGKNERDSLIFEFEPEKKKGMSVTSKGMNKQPQTKQTNKQFEINMNNKQSQTNMINLKDNLTSKIVGIKKEGNGGLKAQEMIRLNNKTLVSRQIQAQKVLKENEQFLIKSGIMDLSSSYKPKPYNQNIGSDYLLQLQDERDPLPSHQYKQPINNERPWHEIAPKGQEQFLPIKKVERSEKVINNKEKEQRELAAREREEKELAARMREEKEIAQKRQIELKQMKARQAKERLRLENERKQQQKRQREKQEQQIQKQKAQQRRMTELQMQRERQNERQLKLKNRQIQKRRQQEQSLRLQQQAERLNKQNEERQKKKKRQNQYPITTFPRQMSENESEKSNKSSKKGKGKKQSSISRDKTHKVQVRNQSPRAEQSYYQSNASAVQKSEQLKEQACELEDKFDLIQQKKPKLLNFEDDQIDLKPKSKTDTNFYDFTHSQNSIKAPSSRPPLSKKSNSSVSKSKQKRPKQSTLANNISKKVQKSAYLKPAQKNTQKLTLMQRALLKHNESDGSCSQESFRSSEDVGSKNSRESISSKNSKKSLKKESTIGINVKSNTMLNLGKPPLGKKHSSTSQHEEELLQLQKQREKMVEENRAKEQLLRQRAIISKNCTFIDERGRLVQQDLVIKGSDVYGVPGFQDSHTDFKEKMRRSRQGRRSRSKSRERRNNGNQSSQNEGYYNSSSLSFYENSAYNKKNPQNSQYNAAGNSGNNLILKQFLKPVEQVPNYSRGRGQKVSTKRVEQGQKESLNQFFGNRVQQSTVSNNTNQSRSRKSLHRTQKSNSKR